MAKAGNPKPAVVRLCSQIPSRLLPIKTDAKERKRWSENAPRHLTGGHFITTPQQGVKQGRGVGRKEGLEKGLKKAVRKDNDMAWDRRSVTFWKPVSGLFRFPSRKPFPA